MRIVISTNGQYVKIELKTPIQQKQIDVSRDSLSLVSRLINIPSMVDSSVDDDYYMTMDETPKLEEHSSKFSVFDSSEKISFTTSIKNPPQFAVLRTRE